jgi:predicted NBD/HSP70 family sugar kinase
MDNAFDLIEPQIKPPLDDQFRPAILANQHYRKNVANQGEPLIIGLQREENKVSRYKTLVYPDDHPNAAQNLDYVERIVKFLLWQRGGYKIFIGPSENIGSYIKTQYSDMGKHNFDTKFMGENVYEQPFEVVICDPAEVPDENEAGESIGGHLDGYRIGFDLGASDRKVSAVVDGKVIYSEEKIWEPSLQSDPNYHYSEIMESLRTAAEKMPQLYAIGGSSAGIYINNRPMVASLFRGIPEERLDEVRNLFINIENEFGVPFKVINDGDVTALAGSMTYNDTEVLGIALGSSEAGGYVDRHGHILGWLNELSFAPIDYSPTASVDEWSKDIGCGSTYLSQQCVFRLAPLAGIKLDKKVTDAEKLSMVQEKLQQGHEGAVKIWQTMGVYLGYAIAHYADFYQIKHVVILGRCTSYGGGSILVDQANKVLKHEFPELHQKISLHLPDEKDRRVGQAIAAASLPEIN